MITHTHFNNVRLFERLKMDVDTETASALVRSEIRIGILYELWDGPATKYELRDRLDCSRTTVDRNLDHLLDGGWIGETSGGYRLTTCGEIVVEEATAYLETVTVTKKLQPILRWIPRESLDLDVRQLADAEITLGTDEQPMAMVDKHAQALKESPTAKLILPIVSQQPLEAQVRSFELEELSLEIIAPPSIVETLANDQPFAHLIEELREAGAIDLYVTERSVPYYLGILGETIQIGVDDDGQPKGLLESTADPVQQWADKRFAEYRESATPLAEWGA